MGRVANRKQDTLPNIKMRILVIIGVAFLWPCLHVDIYSPLTFITTVADLNRYMSCLLFVALGLLVLIILLLLHWQPFKDLVSTKSVSIMFLIGFMGSGALALGTWGSIQGYVIIYVVALIFDAIWLVFAINAWCTQLYEYSIKTLVIDICISYLLYCILNMITQFTFNYIYWGYLLLSPLCTLGLLVAVRKYIHVDQTSDISIRKISYRELSKGIVIPITIILSLAIVITRVINEPESYSSTLESRGVTLIFSIIVMIITIIIIFIRGWNRNVGLSVFCFMAVLVAFGFVLMALLSSYNLNFYKRFVVGSEHCLEVILFASLLIEAVQKHINPLTVAIYYLAACFISPRMLANIIMLLLGNTMILDELGIAIASVASLAAFVIAIIIVWYLQKNNRTNNIENPEQEKRQQEILTKEIADTWRLTEREAQVVMSYYKGGSKKAVAAELCIAESTVKTHLKRAYMKMGVNTRQELTEIITNYSESEI